MPATVLIITPNPLLDCLHDGHITPGKVTRSQGMDVVAGGKGLNVGRILCAHGHRVLATGFAGGWSGTAFRAIVASEGQDESFIDCVARLRLGFMAKDCADAGSTAVLENGFMVQSQEQDALIQHVQSQVASCDLVIISGSVPHQNCEQLFVCLLDICNAANVPCWIDSYGPAMDAALQHTRPPQMVKPNREEYITSDLWSQAAECHITDGDAATTVFKGDISLRITSPAITCINAIGSGDSYIGALAHARLSNYSFEDQLCYAAAAGSINASQMAVACMQPSDIKSMSSTVQVTPGAD
ncbi:MAG: hypothetical protein HRU15_02895 [Planctomycetes bacterium]|nr:hypothetical protein [Planctomycetota bacterium]